MTTKTTKTRAPKAPSALKQLKARYPHISKITATGKKDRPIRVEISCTTAKCKGKREIATQDAFQVLRCFSCQKEHQKASRRKPPVSL